MGNLYVILVAGVIFSSGYLMLDTRSTAHETEKKQASYEETVVAHEIALSAFNTTVSEVKRGFEDWRDQQNLVSYQGGTFDVTTTGPTEGPVDLAVIGYFGNAKHQIDATMDRTLSFLEPLVFDAETVDAVNTGTTFTISGIDTDPPSEGGGEGKGPNMHAVRATLQSVRDAVAAALPANQVYGTDGVGDVIAGLPEIDLDTVFDEALAFPGGFVVIQDTTLGNNDVFGAAVLPKVMVVHGNVTITDTFEGYGVLYVNGNLTMDGFAVWEGLILVDGAASQVRMSGDAQLYGTMVVRDGAPGGPGLAGGHFDVDVFSGPTPEENYHEHQYDDEYNVTFVDLLSAGCGTYGLCWDQIIGNNYDELRVEFFNPDSSSGTYTFTAAGVTLTGAPNEGFTQTFNPSAVTEFLINFESLASMRGTEPDMVQGDIVNRDHAFSVRIYDTATNEMVYELSVYEHIKEDEEDEEGGGGGSNAAQFQIQGSAGIYYSSKALMRLRTLLQSVEDAIEIVVVKQRTKATDLSGRFTDE